MKLKQLVITIFILTGGLSAPLFAQGGKVDTESEWEEEVFRASTKQVNQFFRRFNGEEDPEGNRYLPTDRKYRDYKVRREYLPLLIDPSVYAGSLSTVETFFESVNDKKSPYFLDNHTDDWVAEVNCEFLFQGKSKGVTLMMKLQPQGQGYEWIIEDVNADFISQLFNKDTTDSKPFIHPMSHELDFMNFNKVFKKEINPESYTADNFKPDFLTIFLYELKSNRLQFQSVQSVRFHFFSVPGWYFELSEYNRPGMPSGWLISNLVAVNEAQKQQIKDYVYGR